MPYIQDIARLDQPTFDILMNVAVQNLDEAKRVAPWIGLEHGVKLLENDDEMARYLLAYGNMHKEKINVALDSIVSPQDIFNQPLTIIDWGCGQGIASICFLDYLSDYHIIPDIQKFILIEPSPVTLNRATINIQAYGYENIKPINKYINNLTFEDIDVPSGGLVIHFFSNILDIPSVDIDHIHTLITQTIQSEQLFVCVGPQNIGASRISEFASLFDIQEDNMLAQHNGRLMGRGTIRMLVFKVPSLLEENHNLEILKIEYQPHRHVQDSLLSVVNRLLSSENPYKELNQKSIQFYRVLIDLERRKSVDIRDTYSYPLSYDESNGVCKIQIDLEQNESFLKEFNENKNAQWPKNLNIGISFILDNKSYRLLQYVYPYNDIKGINVARDLVSVPLNSFSVDVEKANELNITEDELATIEAILTSPTINISEILSIVKDAVSSRIVLDTDLQLALTSETPTLSQIRSELKQLETLKSGELLSAFLNGSLPHNTCDTIYKEELIHIFNIDSAQSFAIQKALNSRVSVITGPPGTGKTQMILNLIANALVRGKSVLVASKNNKAVDNVKMRYDSYDKNNYLLRFGSRDVVTNQVIPYLTRIVNILPEIDFDAKLYNDISQQYKSLCAKIRENKQRIVLQDKLNKSKTTLVNERGKLIAEKVSTQQKCAELRSALSAKYEDIIGIISSDVPWRELMNNLNILSVKLNEKRSFIGKIFFKWFEVSKCVEKVIGIYNQLPDELQQSISYDATSIHSESELKQLCANILHNVSRVLQYQIEETKNDNSFKKGINDIEHKIQEKEDAIKKCDVEIQRIQYEKPRLLEEISQAKEESSLIGETLFRNTILARLKRPDAQKDISLYRAYLPDQSPRTSNEQIRYQDIVEKFIQIFLLNSVTSLSIKKSFPLQDGLFDIVIIDEASQCDVASALPLIQRAKQLVVVGDPLQLKHITPVNVDEEMAIKNWMSLSENPLLRYVGYSLYDYCNDLLTTSDTNNRPLVLDYHYRCHPDIIGYSNTFFYQRRLQTSLNICTPQRQLLFNAEGIRWINVEGEQESETRNINVQEIEKCVDIAFKFATSYPTVTIGIISPFKHQVEAIKAYYNQRTNNAESQRIRIDTVHKFQGDECDVIIYSLVVTGNSPDSKIRWIDRGEPNLVNVAVTRARNLLCVVGNKNYIRKHSRPDLPLGYLLTYSEQINSNR